jgi:CheY-like chemotaxis protein
MPTAGEARSILLAEDNANDVILLERAFNRAQILAPLRIVEDGEQAIHYLAGDGPYADRLRYPLPGLLLLDLKLPRKSGFEVLTWLRQQPGLKRLPVVVFTSSRESGDVEQAYDLGANSYLVKPAGTKDLLEMVQGLHLYWMVLNTPPQTLPGK